MRPELELFIKQSYDENLIDLFTDIFKLFDDLEIPDYDNNYIALMMDENSAQDVVDSFRAAVHLDVVVILRNFGIHVVDDASLNDCYELLYSVTLLEWYEDSVALIDSIQGEEHAVDRLSEMLKFTSDKSPEYWLQVIHQVNDSLIIKIQNLHAEKANNSNVSEEDDLTDEAKQLVVAKLKRIKEIPEYKIAIGFTMLQNGILIGLPFATYIETAKAELDKLNISDIAMNLVVLLFMSKDGFVLPLQTYQKNSHLLFEDISKITQVDLALSTKLMQIRRLITMETHDD